MSRPALLAIALIALLVLAAHITRYEPLPGGEPLGVLPLWDRWLHRVCVVTFALKNRPACAAEDLDNQNAATSREKGNQKLAEDIRAMKQAGFSDKEIVDYVVGKQSH